MKDLKIASILLIFLALTFVFTVLSLLTGSREPYELVIPEFESRIEFEGAASIDNLAFNPMTKLLYIADSGTPEIYVTDLNGNICGHLSRRSYGEEGISSVADLCSYANGILISDSLERQVFYFRCDSKATEFIEDELPIDFVPGKIATINDREVIVFNSNGTDFIIVNEFGSIEKREVLTENTKPDITGVSFNNKNIYVLLGSSASIIEISSEGERKVVLKGRKGAYSPFGLSINSGYFLIADPFYGEVIFFDDKGNEAGSFGGFELTERLELPVDIDSYGDYFFVAEKGGAQVSIWKRK